MIKKIIIVMSTISFIFPVFSKSAIEHDVENDVKAYIAENIRETKDKKDISSDELKRVLIGWYTYDPKVLYVFKKDGVVYIKNFGCINCSIKHDVFEEYWGKWRLDDKTLTIEVSIDGKKYISSVHITKYTYIVIPGIRRGSLELYFDDNLIFGGEGFSKGIKLK